jgi:hypothetical protein
MLPEPIVNESQTNFLKSQSKRNELSRVNAVGIVKLLRARQLKNEIEIQRTLRLKIHSRRCSPGAARLVVDASSVRAAVPPLQLTRRATRTRALNAKRHGLG